MSDERSYGAHRSVARWAGSEPGRRPASFGRRRWAWSTSAACRGRSIGGRAGESDRRRTEQWGRRRRRRRAATHIGRWTDEGTRCRRRLVIVAVVGLVGWLIGRGEGDLDELGTPTGPRSRHRGRRACRRTPPPRLDRLARDVAPVTTTPATDPPELETTLPRNGSAADRPPATVAPTVPATAPLDAGRAAAPRTRRRRRAARTGVRRRRSRAGHRRLRRADRRPSAAVDARRRAPGDASP